MCTDFKQELTKLNKEVLFSFHELLSFLINQPSQMSQQTANISTLLRNMHHLLNMLRPHQVSTSKVECPLLMLVTSSSGILVLPEWCHV